LTVGHRCTLANCFGYTPVYLGLKVEKRKLATAWYEGQWERVAKNEAEFSKEPSAIHFANAVDNSSHAHDAATRHRHLFVVVFIDFGFRDASMDNEPAAPLGRPIPVFNVFAVMENVMRVRLLNAQSLDLSRSDAIRQSEEVDTAVCCRLLVHD